MVIKTVYHFIDSNHGVEISSKRQRLTEKRDRRAGKGERWEVLEVFLPRSGTNDLLWERKGLPGG